MKKSNIISKKRGFTLTEIIVTIALTTLVLAMIGGSLYFISTYSGVLITKSEQLTRAQTIETSLRNYADADISQLAYVKLDSEGNLVFKDKTILENTGLENFAIYSVGNYEENPTRYFVKCKFNFPDDEPFDFILGIANYIVQDDNADNDYAYHFDKHYNVPYNETVDFSVLAASNYASIIIPDSVTSIPDNAFSNCEFTINIPNTVTSIGKNAFSNCSKLVYLTISNSITSIGEGAFAGSNLTNVIIPNSVTSIPSDLFSKCESLVSITYIGSVEQWNSISKGDNWNNNTGDYTIYCTDGTIAKDGTVTTNNQN